MLLLFSMPVILFCFFLIRVGSGRRVVFKQVRIGRGMRPFTIYKMRTMKLGFKEGEHNVLRNRKDPPVTPIGQVLRFTKLDELLQLFNVVKGEMNFIGPRPLRVKLHNHYMKHIRNFKDRYCVQPGITGLSQLIDPGDKDRNVGLAADLYYIKHKSTGLNSLIVICTGFYVVRSVFEGMYLWIKAYWMDRVQTDIELTNESEDLGFTEKMSDLVELDH